MQFSAELSSRKTKSSRWLRFAETNGETRRWAVAFYFFFTWICFFGVFLALASDDEDENEEEDEDEAHQSDHDQEPPLLVERRHFLGWKHNTETDTNKENRLEFV